MGTWRAVSGRRVRYMKNLYFTPKIAMKVPAATAVPITPATFGPMAARVSQKVGAEADPTNFLLMHAMGPNVAGVIGTARCV